MKLMTTNTQIYFTNDILNAIIFYSPAFEIHGEIKNIQF
jgi:hypothetical protein